MKLTFASVKASCAKVLNLNASDARVLDYVNLASERLLYKCGKSVDTVARYTVCATSGQITWPREFETIEAWAHCSDPGTVRNQWFEFLDNGPGLMCATDGSRRTLVDRGNAVAFDEVIGSNKKLAIYPDGQEDASLTTLIRYFDHNANKVFTEYNGEVIEGERIGMPDPGDYSLSTYFCMPGGVYEIIKPVTKRILRLFEWDTVNMVYRALGQYDPDETLPVYRRSLIPCLNSGSNEGGECEKERVTVLAKRRFIPATGDDSVLLFSHAGAVRLACQAIKLEEDVGVKEAELYWQAAKMACNEQLAHWQGDGVVAPIRVERFDLGAAGVINMI